MLKIRFNSRDKKPKIYNIFCISVLFIVFLIFYEIRKPFIDFYAALVFAFYLTLIIFFLLDAFVKQLEYNPYSYNSIYYISFALFTGSLLLSDIVFMIEYKSIHVMGYTYGFINILHMILGSATGYMLYSMPLILIVSIILVVSNIFLIRKEGKSLGNSLAIILAVLLIGGEIFIFANNYYFTGSLYEVITHEMILNTIAAIYIYFECMIIGTAIVGYLVASYEPDHDADYIIILGCGIDSEGKPLPLLASRIDRALNFYKRQKETNDKELTFITSGGKGYDEIISESQSMKNYLLDKGIDEKQIIMEDRSTNTYENMDYSRQLMESSEDKKVLFSTSDFHVFRSGLMARRLKMRAIGIGAKTKWYFYPNATVREFVGLLTKHKTKQALVVAGMILFYIICTIVVYML